MTGAGKAFCAGADLTALGEAAEDGPWGSTTASSPSPTAPCRPSPRSTVAAVGAGLNLALAADVRIAGPHAMFDPRFQKLGIHPGGGATWMLQRGVGPQVARASLLFGMRFDADVGRRHRLALPVADDPVAAARELAAGPAAAPRDVVIATKASMRATATPGAVDTDLHRTAVRSNSARRPPRSSRRISGATGRRPETHLTPAICGVSPALSAVWCLGTSLTLMSQDIAYTHDVVLGSRVR